MIVTEEMLESVKSLRGGYTRAVLTLLGVAWPPKHGWPKRIVRTTIPDDIFVPDPNCSGRLMINPNIGVVSKTIDKEILKRYKIVEDSVVDLTKKERRKRRAQRRKEREEKEYSYVIGALTTKYIKIGKTTKPIKERLAALQTASPYKLVLLGTSDAKEEALHRRFRKYRVRGTEWFEWNDDLKHFISYECHPVKAWRL